WRDRDDVCIAGDIPLYFSETQRLRRDFRVPDVYVVTETERRERKKWVVWEEDGRAPDVIIEVTSETTEKMDGGEKKTIYERLLRVPTYVIYDPAHRARPARPRSLSDSGTLGRCVARQAPSRRRALVALVRRRRRDAPPLRRDRASRGGTRRPRGRTR